VRRVERRTVERHERALRQAGPGERKCGGEDEDGAMERSGLRQELEQIMEGLSVFLLIELRGPQVSRD
jgi:hypothetical protein